MDNVSSDLTDGLSTEGNTENLLFCPHDVFIMGFQVAASYLPLGLPGFLL